MCAAGMYKTAAGNSACATCDPNSAGCRGTSAGVCNSGYYSSGNGVACIASIYSHVDELTFGGTASTVVNLSTELSAVQGNNPRTVMFMMKTSSTDAQCPISTGTPATGQTFNFLVWNGGYIGVMGYSRDFYPNSATFVADGQWHHVKVTWDSVTLRIYIDGAFKLSTTTMSGGGTSYATSGNNNFLGKSNHAGNENYFDGQLKDIYFFDIVI